MKVNGSESTFKYSSELWTNSQTFQPSRFDLDYNETKLQSFSTVDFTELYLRVVTASVTREIIIPVQSTSLLNLLKDGNYTAVDLGRDPWLNLVPGSFLQDYCNMVTRCIPLLDKYAIKRNLGGIQRQHPQIKTSANRNRCQQRRQLHNC